MEGQTLAELAEAVNSARDTICNIILGTLLGDDRNPLAIRDFTALSETIFLACEEVQQWLTAFGMDDEVE